MPEHPKSVVSPVSELLLRWEELRQQNQSISAEELCRDAPELLEEVRRRIQVLEVVYHGPHQTTPPHAGAGGPTPSRPPPVPHVEGYEILETLGYGGMGVVYKALQARPQRLVALKMILSGRQAGPHELARFHVEAEMIAALQHPHIVQLYEVGEADGCPYLALEYVDGGSLAQRLREQPVSPREAAALVRMLALAVDYAHRRGVIHRDLKPANVLLSLSRPSQTGAGGVPVPDGRLNEVVPKITDFGLAKRLDAGAGPTRSGDVLGTPAYMAPEQAEGRSRDVGTLTDVYALGAILYELLTGRPPFQADTPVATLLLVAHEEPKRPSQLGVKLPRDLETICLKCLHKEPPQRYATAEALADDLGRFLAGYSIKARPVTRAERVWRWCRRNPRIAGLAALVLVLVPMALVALLFSDSNRFERLKFEAAELRRRGRPGQRFEALEKLRQARQTWAAAWSSDNQRELRKEAIACLALTDLKEVRLGKEDWQGVPPGTPVLTFDGRFEHYARTDSAGTISVRRVRDDEELGRLPNPQQPLPYHAYWMRFSPDGKFLAVMHHEEHCVRVWDWRREEMVFQTPRADRRFDWGPDSRRLAAVLSPSKENLDSEIVVYEVPSKRVLQRIRMPEINGVTFSPEGKRLAIVRHSSDVLVCDVATGQVLQSVRQPTRVRGLPIWHPEGNYLAVPNYREQICVWNVRTGVLQASLAGNFGITHAAFSPQGDLLASIGWDGVLRLSDPFTGQPLLAMVTEQLGSVQFGWRDAATPPLIWTQHGAQVRTWEVHRGAGHQAWPLPVEVDELLAARFSPDGRLLAVGTRTELQLWDLAAGKRHDLLVPGWTLPAFHPDGARLFTTGPSGLFQWPIRQTDETLRLGPPERLGAGATPLDGIAVRADGAALLASDHEAGVLFDLKDQERPPQVLPHKSVEYVALSRDGRWAATGIRSFSFHGQVMVKVWDLQRPEGPLLSHEFPFDQKDKGIASIALLRFSPDNRYLLTGTQDEYRAWKVGSWQLDRSLTLRRKDGFHAGAGMTFSADGSLLAVIPRPGEIELRDFARRQMPLATLIAPGQPRLGAMTFAADGSRLAACSQNAVHLWDLRQLRRELAALGLDWDQPAFPETVAEKPRPLAVEFRLTAKLYEERALASWGRFNYEPALTNCERALELDPYRPATNGCVARVIALGPRAFRERDPAAVARTLGRAEIALRQEPRNVDALTMLGVLQFRLGQHELAVQTLETLIRDLGKGEIRAWEGFVLAMCHHHLGNAAESRRYFDAARLWLADHPNQSAVKLAELRALRTEAEALLPKGR